MKAVSVRFGYKPCAALQTPRMAPAVKPMLPRATPDSDRPTSDLAAKLAEDVQSFVVELRRGSGQQEQPEKLAQFVAGYTDESIQRLVVLLLAVALHGPGILKPPRQG